METNNSKKKKSKSSENRPSRAFYSGRNAQMIVLMGVTLSISVLLMGALAAEISDINVAIPQARTSDLLPEFIHIKGVFGYALNYNLVDIKVIDDNFIFEKEIYDATGTCTAISDAVDQTSNAFRNIELQHDRLFVATYNEMKYSHISTEGIKGNVYNVFVTLTLEGDESMIEETVMYSIVCNEPEL